MILSYDNDGEGGRRGSWLLRIGESKMRCD